MAQENVIVGPDGRRHRFPEGATEAQMTEVMRSEYPDAFGDVEEQPRSRAEGFVRAVSQNEPIARGALQLADFVAGLRQQNEGMDRQGTTEQMNAGIFSVLGAPVDLFNAGLGAVGVPVSDTPFLGSRSLAGGAEAVGIRVADEEPETLAQHVARGGGEAAGALAPAGFVARGLAAGTGIAAGIGQQINREAVRAPARFAAAEIAAGAGAGAGRAVAEGSGVAPHWAPWLETAGGVVGGMGPAGVMRAIDSSPILGSAIRWGQGQVFPFTEAGARARASERVRSLSEDPEAARAALDAPNEAGLSPAAQTGDPRLISLERTARRNDPVLDAQMRENEVAATAALREMVLAPSQGQTADATRAFLSDRMDSVLTRLDERVTEAGRRAQERIDAIRPERRASESALIVREEIETAYKAARSEESAMWNSVPEGTTVPTGSLRARYNDLVANTPRAQQDDIPEIARRMIAGKEGVRLGDSETIREVYGLYSALRESARNARAAGNLNLARISDQLADAALEGLGAGADVTTAAGLAINEARGVSRRLNNRFTRGPIGRLLGYSRDGGEAIAPEMTLASTIGSGRERGAVGVDSVRRATAAGESEQAMEDYLRSRFETQAMRGENLSLASAETFLRNNAETLDRFPQLQESFRSTIEEAARAGRIERDSGQRAARLRDPNQSVAAQFIGSPVEGEIERLLRANDPGDAAERLTRLARRDSSGKALAGLRGAFVSHLLGRARIPVDVSASGVPQQPFVSGSTLIESLRDPRTLAAAREILSPEQLDQLNMVATQFRRIEAAQSGSLPSVGPSVIDNPPNNVISFIARVAAARQGARAGAGTSGASLATASFASQRMQRILKRLTNDQAEALLVRALSGDRELFAALLAPATTRSESPSQRIIETLIALGAGDIAEAADQDTREQRALEPQQ